MYDYKEQFYEAQRDTAHHAALTILPTILALCKPQSIVDLGCGWGGWLAAAGELGVANLVGIDGEWVKHADLIDPSIRLITHDLEKPLALNETFDLAISLEVAEHLSPDRARSFVRELCAAAKRVVFSAAIPGQGGTNHINEQWQDYWAQLFGEEGFQGIDVIRPKFWDDPSIPIHYRQNTLLYVHSTEYRAIAENIGHQQLASTWKLNMVHPELHLNNWREVSREPTLREAMAIVAKVPGLVIRTAKRLLASRPRSG